MLLDAGADVNKSRTDNGATPLWIASHEGKSDVVRLLLDAGADLGPSALPRELFLRIFQYYTRTC